MATLWFEGFDDLQPSTNVFGSTEAARKQIVTQTGISSSATVTSTTRFSYGAGLSWASSFPAALFIKFDACPTLTVGGSGQKTVVGFAAKTAGVGPSVPFVWIASNVVQDSVGNTITHVADKNNGEAYMGCIGLTPGGTVWNGRSNNVSNTAVNVSSTFAWPSPVSNWNYYEIQMVYNNATSITTVTVRQNTVPVITYDIASPYSFKWTGKPMIASPQSLTSIDDFYINWGDYSESIPYKGDSRITLRTPAADTAAKAFVPSAGSTNFNMVNQVPADGDTTYVQSNTLNAEDLYTTSTATYTPAVVHGVKFVTVAKDSGSGTAQLRNRFKIGSTSYNASSTTLTSAYTCVGHDQAATTTNPATSATWTASDIDNIQFGFRKIN